MEDILLRTAPIETYNAWINHEIPFNDPEVLEAAELMKQIWFTPDYAYGGSTYINATWIGETQDPMFVRRGTPVLDAEAGSLDRRLLGRQS